MLVRWIVMIAAAVAFLAFVWVRSRAATKPLPREPKRGLTDEAAQAVDEVAEQMVGRGSGPWSY